MTLVTLNAPTFVGGVMYPAGATVDIDPSVLAARTSPNALQNLGQFLQPRDLATALVAVGAVSTSGFNYATPANTQSIRSAMARSDRNALIGCVGPSTTAGTTIGGGTAQATNCWPVQVAKLLQAQGIQAGAENFFGDHACWGVGGSTTANYLTGDTRLAFTGSPAPFAANTVGGLAWFMLAAAGTMVFTPTTGVTKFRIWYRDVGSSPQFSWAIDGGAATTVAYTNTNTLKNVVVSAGTVGAHALTIAWVAGNVGIVGVEAYNDTGGRREISFLNWGIAGARSDQLVNDTDSPPAAGRITAMNTIAPDLLILDDFAINDWRQGTSIQNLQTSLQAGITQGLKTGSVVVTTPLWDNFVGGTAAQQNDYVNATIQVAMANNVPIIDVRAAWVSFAAANGLGWYSDAVHPTQLGYAVKAAAIAEFIRRLKAM